MEFVKPGGSQLRNFRQAVPVQHHFRGSVARSPEKIVHLHEVWTRNYRNLPELEFAEEADRQTLNEGVVGDPQFVEAHLPTLNQLSEEILNLEDVQVT